MDPVKRLFWHKLLFNSVGVSCKKTCTQFYCITYIAYSGHFFFTCAPKPKCCFGEHQFNAIPLTAHWHSRLVYYDLSWVSGATHIDAISLPPAPCHCHHFPCFSTCKGVENFSRWSGTIIVLFYNSWSWLMVFKSPMKVSPARRKIVLVVPSPLFTPQPYSFITLSSLPIAWASEDHGTHLYIFSNNRSNQQYVGQQNQKMAFIL